MTHFDKESVKRARQMEAFGVDLLRVISTHHENMDAKDMMDVIDRHVAFLTESLPQPEGRPKVKVKPEALARRKLEVKNRKWANSRRKEEEDMLERIAAAKKAKRGGNQ